MAELPLLSNLPLTERLKLANAEYASPDYDGWNVQKRAIASKYGFEFVASSARVLLYCPITEKHYKLDTRRNGNANREHAVFSKVQDTKFAERLARVSLVTDFALEVEFIKGKSLHDFYDESPKVSEIMQEVHGFLNKLRKETGINIDDVGGSNIMIEFETERWVITDYAEDWGY